MNWKDCEDMKCAHQDYDYCLYHKIGISLLRRCYKDE
jgi:hypothetical protein